MFSEEIFLYICQSKKRGLSLEEKKKRMLDIFYEKKEFFHLKELEKIAPKEKGISVCYVFFTLFMSCIGVVGTIVALFYCREVPEHERSANRTIKSFAHFSTHSANVGKRCCSSLSRR